MPHSSQTISRFRSLATRFTLWVIMLCMLMIAALGFYFDSFLRNSFLESTRTRMEYGFERLSYNLAQIEAGLREGVAFLREDEATLASVNLINLYEDRSNYNSFLLDEEKKELAAELLDRVKLSFNDDIVLYGRNLDVIAYVARDAAGYHLNYLSYNNSQPELFRRYEHEDHYRKVPLTLMARDEIDYKHINFYADDVVAETTLVTFHRMKNGLVLKSHLGLFGSSGSLRNDTDDQTKKAIAHIEMSRMLDSVYLHDLSENLNLMIRLDPEPVVGNVTVHELMTPEQPDFYIAETNHHYQASAVLETVEGPIFFNLSLERDFLNHALGQNRTHLILLLIVTACVSGLMIYSIVSHRLRKPLHALMTQIRKIEQQDYSETQVPETGDELQMVSGSINRLAEVVRNREASLQKSQQELAYLSDHDVLTGLPNRRFWGRFLNDTLEKARTSRRSLAVLFIDLDQFKQVNDTLGHDVGDELLKAVTTRLAAALDACETLARIGGDEFNLLIDHLAGAEQAEQAAQRILHLFDAPFRVMMHEINISASIGVTLFPDDGQDAISLSKYADLAMYKAKENGRNNYSFFSVELSAQMKERAELSVALREALKTEEQFQLYYQPKISAASGKVVSAEALIRWHHPVYGLVSPARFIPLAEELGLIIPLGDWVLEQGCTDFGYISQQGVDLDHLSINVSSLQLDSDHFIETVDRVLKKTGIPSEKLELEITESYIARQPEEARQRLQYFRDRGIGLAVDDFGTGYSAMSTLQNLPVTRLKIDKSFVDGLPHDANSVALARAIVSLAKNFDLALTAEGVETEQQRVMLTDEQCDELQGYYFSRPLPLPEFLSYCRAQSGENVIRFPQ